MIIFVQTQNKIADETETKQLQETGATSAQEAPLAIQCLQKKSLCNLTRLSFCPSERFGHLVNTSFIRHFHS